MMDGIETSGAQIDRLGTLWWAQDSVSVVLLVVVGIIGAVALFLRKTMRIPPGPRPWPILGSLPLLGELPHQGLARLAQKYGPLMYLRLGSTHTVVASSPEMAREFLQTHDQVFSHRPNTLIAYLHHGKNVAFSEGAYWRHLRKICMLELFSPKRLESFRNARTEEVTATMKTIFDDCRERKVVDLNLKLWSLISNNMTRMLFNKRYFESGMEGQKEAQTFKVLVEKIHYWAGAFIIGDFNPSLRWLSKLQGIDASSFYQHFIDDHRKAAATERGSTYGPSTDFVQVLLSVRSEDGRGNLSDQSIRLVLMDRLNGGTDTSATTIEWAMAELLRNPDVMKRAQTELDAVVGTTRLVEESDLQHLKYLEAVVKENFRLHPAAPLLLPHESRGACQIAGYSLPAKTRLLINVWAIGRDPSIWKRPLAFDPERFVEFPDIDIKGHNFQL